MSDRVMAKDCEDFILVTHESEYHFVIEYKVWVDNSPPTPHPYTHTAVFCNAPQKDSALAVANTLAAQYKIDINYVPLTRKIEQ
jgi:hypothetical protein